MSHCAHHCVNYRVEVLTVHTDTLGVQIRFACSSWLPWVRYVWFIALLIPSACQLRPLPLTLPSVKPKLGKASKAWHRMARGRGSVPQHVCMQLLGSPDQRSSPLSCFPEPRKAYKSSRWTEQMVPVLGPAARPQNRLRSLGRQQKDWCSNLALFKEHQRIQRKCSPGLFMCDCSCHPKARAKVLSLEPTGWKEREYMKGFIRKGVYTIWKM